MNTKEANAFLNKIDTLYGCYLAKDKHRSSEWTEALEKMDQGRALKALNNLCEHKKDNDITPSLHAFKRFYHGASSSYKHSSEEGLSECGSCCSGKRFVMLGGDNVGGLKVLNKDKFAQKRHNAGTTYSIYQTLSIPCNCEKGLAVNQAYYNYDENTMQRLIKHSFINTVDAEEYIDDKLKELKNGTV